MSFVLGLLSILVVVSAVWVVTLPNLFRAALSLGLVLIGVAGLFLLLEAEFLAFVQILVYVGAILTLVVFAIMLTSGLAASVAPPASFHVKSAAAASLSVFVLLTLVTQSLAWPNATTDQAVSVASLGQQFMTTLILPFEVISLVLVAAVVGAIALASTRTHSRS